MTETNAQKQLNLEATTAVVETLLLALDDARKDASIRLDPRRRAQMGQFLTPSSIATFMAGMLDCRKSTVRILDPGAGAGSLCAALVLTLCERPKRPATIAVTAYEIDPVLVGYLRQTLDRCRSVRTLGSRFMRALSTRIFSKQASRGLLAIFSEWGSRSVSTARFSILPTERSAPSRGNARSFVHSGWKQPACTRAS